MGALANQLIDRSAKKSQRVQGGSSRAQKSFINWALLLSLQYILPFLFLSTLLIAGTLAISYTIYQHERLPEHFVLGISLALGILLILTAVLVLLLQVRRFNQRRAQINSDREANRLLETCRVVESPSWMRDQPSDEASEQASEAVIGLDVQGLSRPSPQQEQSRFSGDSVGSLNLQRPQPAHIASPPTPFIPYRSAIRFDQTPLPPTILPPLEICFTPSCIRYTPSARIWIPSGNSMAGSQKDLE